MFGTGFALTATAFGAQIGGWTHWITIGVGYGVGIFMTLVAAISIAKSYFAEHPNASTSPPQPSLTVPGIPSLSALLGQNPNVEFNAKKFFALAYYSPVTSEVEKNIKIIAQKNFPTDKESFYARFIGVGLTAYQHDSTSYVIFGSQLKALLELSSRGVIPVVDLKKHYDKAAAEYPKIYQNYSFEQWLEYMKGRLLIAVYPSQMVELSFSGQDFLKYLSHVGRDLSRKVG